MTLQEEKNRLVRNLVDQLPLLQQRMFADSAMKFADALLEEVAKRADLATAEWIRSGKGK